jgi:hypothetical protein
LRPRLTTGLPFSWHLGAGIRYLQHTPKQRIAHPLNGVCFSSPNGLEIRIGEVALFYSDGLVEAHDPKGEMFGFPRLRALVAEHAEEEGSLEDVLLEKLYSFVGEDWEQEDDITLLALRRVSHPYAELLRTPTFPDVRGIP